MLNQEMEEEKMTKLKAQQFDDINRKLEQTIRERDQLAQMMDHNPMNPG